MRCEERGLVLSVCARGRKQDDLEQREIFDSITNLVKTLFNLFIRL
ncbi:hypothetical protein EBME_1908 [bacterium endosymbiont of Mortierella elongata FMR23-6]|nr:hypothetical protein EBME_1908 [bacterium endosymbiont of Mortierella elongata FMR23-6]